MRNDEPRPSASIVLAKSPKPSTESTAASSNGETKKALATWAWWCSTWCSCGLHLGAERLLRARP